MNDLQILRTNYFPCFEDVMFNISLDYSVSKMISLIHATSTFFLQKNCVKIQEFAFQMKNITLSHNEIQLLGICHANSCVMRYLILQGLTPAQKSFEIFGQVSCVVQKMGIKKFTF